MNRRQFFTYSTAAAAGAAWTYAASSVLFGRGSGAQLLNCSYDATRELYRNLNRLFAQDWQKTHGSPVRVTPSHGGSGSQARAVIDGLPADVVTLAMWPDTDAIRKKGLINNGQPGWEERLPSRSCPYTSTIVFVVRKGNPFGIRDWSDLEQRDGIRIVAANPKTSGAAKLGVIACWGSVIAAGGSEADAAERVRRVYRKVPSLETSSRAASVTFSRKLIGDVQLTWENEAWLEWRELKGDVEVIYPKSSLLAEPHVALVDANAERNGTVELAEAYLKFLYTPAAQAVFAENYFRPSNPDAELAKKLEARFQPLQRFTVDAAMNVKSGGWEAATKKLFADGALFDKVFEAV